MPAKILLATLNARYIHASLGLRYLRANLGELREQSEIREYTIKRAAIEIVEDVLAAQPRIVGFGVYIWNVLETTRVVALLKSVAPDLIIVLGGPEVSYETEDQAIVQLADYVITGPGDVTFAALCRQLLGGEVRGGEVLLGESPLGDRHPGKVMAGEARPLAQLVMPYRDYTDEDIAQRFIYVEASRGCPFKCEFCLSALDKTAKPFELERFLDEMQQLYARGARHFKFVDRTFNLNAQTGVRILEFFLARLDERLFLHFEVIPDHLPEALKALIVQFPSGSLQFEVGVQTFNPAVQALISRKQDNDKTADNLRWLRQHSQAHLHADLIIGLPGETLESFAAGFDRLWRLGPHEIQVGVLKRLRGAPIARHTQASDMRYNPLPPYEILSTQAIGFADMRRLTRFAGYWDRVANSGRFSVTLPLLLADQPFQRFFAFSDWLYGATGMTGELALDRLFKLLLHALPELFGLPEPEVRAALVADYQRTENKNLPRFLQEPGLSGEASRDEGKPGRKTSMRQERHGV